MPLTPSCLSAPGFSDVAGASGGICPGPAMVSIMAPHSNIGIFFCMCMFIVMGFYPLFDNTINKLNKLGKLTSTVLKEKDEDVKMKK